MSGTKAKVRKKVSGPIIWVLILAVIILTDTASGMICWRQATKAAEIRAAEKMQTYINEHSVDNVTTYQRLSDSWNHTLENVYGDVVFFGDSLTAQGSWEEYFPYLSTVNLGVVGDTTQCLLIRLPQVETLMCEKCFLMIGVNDLNYQATIEQSLQNYDELLAGLAVMEQETGMRVYVQSVLPVREEETVYDISNQTIRELNRGIEALADGYGMTYIDVHSFMADETGNLEKSYSRDGLHLSENGYQTWQEILAPYLDE